MLINPFDSSMANTEGFARTYDARKPPTPPPATPDPTRMANPSVGTNPDSSRMANDTVGINPNASRLANRSVGINPRATGLANHECFWRGGLVRLQTEIVVGIGWLAVFQRQAGATEATGLCEDRAAGDRDFGHDRMRAVLRVDEDVLGQRHITEVERFEAAQHIGVGRSSNRERAGDACDASKSAKAPSNPRVKHVAIPAQSVSVAVHAVADAVTLQSLMGLKPARNYCGPFGSTSTIRAVGFERSTSNGCGVSTNEWLPAASRAANRT